MKVPDLLLLLTLPAKIKFWTWRTHHRQWQAYNYDIRNEVGDDQRIVKHRRHSTILILILHTTPVGSEMCSTGEYKAEEEADHPNYHYDDGDYSGPIEHRASPWYENATVEECNAELYEAEGQDH